MGAAPSGRYRCREAKSVTGVETNAILELARLLEADYAVAFVRISKLVFQVRAVKRERVIETKASTISEALHKAFLVFREEVGS